MKRKRILWVLRPFRGGMKTHICHLLRNLDPGRVEVTVASPVARGSALGVWQPAALGNWLALPASYPRSPLGFAAAVLKLRRILRNRAFDACHAHGLTAALLCCAAVHARSPAPPVAVTAHNRLRADPRLLRFLQWLTRGRDLHLCAVSGAVRRSLEGFGSSARVIPNGWPPLSEKGARGGGPCRLLYVGRLVRDKGPDVLVSALARVTSMPWRLQVVGAGPMEGRLRGMVHRQNLGDRVSFEGWTEDVFPFYREADLLVLPSRTEGAGLVISEAMSCGLAVLASAVGGIPEMLEHRSTGWLVSPGDPAALGEGLARLIGDGQLRDQLGMAARRRAAQRPSWRDAARRVEMMYREIIEG